MINIYNGSLDKTITVDRIIFEKKGSKKEPTVVFFACVHGNETAGVFALKEVLDQLNESQINGAIYAIVGNLKALEANQRYIDEDLNRIWTKFKINQINTKHRLSSEEKEQKEIFQILERIIGEHSGPLYFIDLHTTSSKTLPFITINDALINRKFSKLFPVPIVLGIEEYLEGPMLSYINELGYVSIGFESGQHDEVDAVLNAIAFINLTLVYSGVMIKEAISNLEDYYNRLINESKGTDDLFEVVYLYTIKEGETFAMRPGFKSFEKINKKTPLATSNNQPIISNFNARIFMPLYQSKGKDGFFIIRKIRPIFLKLSASLRALKLDRLLVLLPGVSWENKDERTLQVNLKTARFLTKPLFHLLGYRNKHINKDYMKLYNREWISKTNMYKNEKWFKR
ncbi:MAG: succinylglutamate desuccinylase/aspartoacylase family protein [Gelidibacter sp.]|nr:succinylglutamate desuccinylase/aspartoacylase family protein [Gelidibacter sp.]